MTERTPPTLAHAGTTNAEPGCANGAAAAHGAVGRTPGGGTGGPVQEPTGGPQATVLDRDDRTCAPAPPSALERILSALAGATHPGAAWADGVDTSDEAAALARLRADATALAHPADPQALRQRLAVHLLALELLASRYAARAEAARRDADRAALAAVGIRALGVAARTAALIAATAPGPVPPDGDGAAQAVGRRPRIR